VRDFGAPSRRSVQTLPLAADRLFEIAVAMRGKPSRSFGRREGIRKSARGYGAEGADFEQI